MLKNILKQLLPDPILDSLQKKKNSFTRKKIMQEWENKGQPLPTPHEAKQLTIEQYTAATHCTILVETGTYLGHMIYSQRNNFKKIYSIELSLSLWEKAKEKFHSYKHIELIQGDSGKVLSTIVQKLDDRALFWLDGHYSGGITAKGEKECPIFEELNAIFNNNLYQHTILIDDAFLFVGANDYPSIDELTSYLNKLNVNYKLSIENNIIILVPIETAKVN